jgi:hypothetical protein
LQSTTYITFIPAIQRSTGWTCYFSSSSFAAARYIFSFSYNQSD